MTTVEVFAPAKINLTLHVTGQRSDGYHELDSLVAFAPFGDRVIIQDGNALSLTVEGPEADGVPADMSNLALRAAGLVADDRGASLLLEKNLPVASGIGGGSTDAAAALRGMVAKRYGLKGHEFHRIDEVLRPFEDQILALGADIPMCLAPATYRVRGIGERLEHVLLPALPALLVNPRVPVLTAAVFAELRSKANAPMPEATPGFAGTMELIEWLAGQRNDLEAPAVTAEPVIGEVLDVLTSLPESRLARMSGSGATCFALFETTAAAVSSSTSLRRRHPDWWIMEGTLGSQTYAAAPRLS